jgi:rare lipoprotein A
MGRKFTGASLTGIARSAALALGCLALAHCSAGSKYNERVVADGEPVPKGGGNYQVGKPYNINGRTYVPNDNPSYRAEGIASWYGPDFHGRSTANGELYDMHAISAAHTTMPLPSYARVTNLDNGRSIIVRVNDRGPYMRNRIIDLSIGTAKALDFYGHGLARVRVEYVGRAPLEGSDDAMLLATLRDGSAAPAPSKVMIASAKPFLPKVGNGKDMALPSEPLSSSTRSPEETSANQTPASQQSASDFTSSNRSQMRSRSASADPRMELIAPSAPAPAAPRNEAPMLGLMSGRGLY